MAKKPSDRPKPLRLDTERDMPLRGRPRKVRDDAQPSLPFDPMPARIDPCLALLAAKPPEGPDWAYEVKWDGYRVAVHVEMSGDVRVLTRGGHDWSRRFPGIVAAASKLGPATMILDGEAVVLDDRGRSDFNALVGSLGGRGGKLPARDTVLFAFDLLYLDGHDLTRMSYEERRAMLEPLLSGLTGPIRLSETIDATGAELFASACGMGLEGIIAKRLDSPYRSGRGGEWRKVKCVQSETFAVVGYVPSRSARGGLAKLLLAALRDGKLVSVGSVGTGFTEKSARDLKARLEALRGPNHTNGSPRGSSAVYVEPALAAEIEYRAWTADGKLRHASFKGLRDPEDSDGVYSLDG